MVNGPRCRRAKQLSLTCALLLLPCLLAAAVPALEAIMKQYGEHVAGDTVARLYNDVGRIHGDIQRYEPAEVLD